MRDYIKKHINNILSIFILFQPILDLTTGIFVHTLNSNFTAGIIIKLLFACLMMYIAVFIYKKYKLIIPYALVLLYGLLYILGIYLYKDNSIFIEIQYLVKSYYFIVIILALYSLKDEIKISYLTLFTSIALYITFIFVPNMFNIGYKTYEITKVGYLGLFNSANEIGGIISIMTPITFIIFCNRKNILKKLTFTIFYLIVILNMGTKTPLLSLIITTLFSLGYFWYKNIRNKNYKSIFYSILIMIFLISSLIVVIPKTNFYKNIETHFNYLKLNKITDVFKDKELFDHFIFSQRLTFLEKKAKLYNKANAYQKLFGIGYINGNKQTKLIEMDYFDILYSHGIVGFLCYFGILLFVLRKILKVKKKITYERYMLAVSFILTSFLSFFTGHIITAPSVSLFSAIIIIKLAQKNKKNLLFSAVNLEIGGIEKALLNIVNRIDKNKYNVTIILEESKGSLLTKLDKEIVVKEIKVSTSRNVIMRKVINYSRKVLFKIFNYNRYDFSCCYATYSYSANAIAKLASFNNSFYVHSNYKYIYTEESDFREFFDSRKVKEYKNIIFVSNEAKQSFVDIYPELGNKSIVLNNFVDTKEITEKSKIHITEKRTPNKKLFVFVGRLDDSSKKLKRAIDIAKEIDCIELWIIGDGPDKKMYEDYTKSNNLLKKVKFIGKKDNPYPYMSIADYIILTSDYEGFPVTYLEAITLGKSIITTFQSSDDSINIKDYAFMISKNNSTMINQVKDIIKKEKKIKKIDLDKIQYLRMLKFQEIFDSID